MRTAARVQDRTKRSNLGAMIGRATEHLERFASRKHRWLVLAIVVGGLLLAWRHRFLMDDAFISFNYSRSLLDGNGLTWFGERVEGYTNFLWVLWVALGMKLGVEPGLWSFVAGLASFAGVLYYSWRLAYLLFREALPALLVVCFIVVNHSMLSFATGGMETMAQAVLLCAGFVLAYELDDSAGLRWWRVGLISVLLAAAVLLRLDSAVAGLVVGALALFHMRRRGARLSQYALLVLPFIVIVGGWFLWKYAYYGRLLPNTFYAKVGITRATLGNGVTYLFRFFHWYSLWPIVLAGLLAAAAVRRRLLPKLTPLVVVVLLWFAYLVAVGGDFMEFRLLVPILPFISVLLAYLVWYRIGAMTIRQPVLVSLIALALVVWSSAAHARRFKSVTEDQTLDSTVALATFYGIYPNNDWRRIGDRLGADLSGTDAVLALHAVGAIPYYSRLRTVDMLGLNDRWVAESGSVSPPAYRRPGHHRHATIAYLRRRQVNFVVGHPTFLYRGVLADPRTPGFLRDWLPQTIQFSREPVRDPVMVVAPIDERMGLLMWYLTPTPEIDLAIKHHGWEVWRVPLLYAPK